jgi:cold-inducible RNA-binding protein
MAKKIYFGNLSFQTTEADVSEMFGNVGTDDAAAEKAIAVFNGKEVNGRQLTVNEARPMEKKHFGDGGRRDRY